MLHLRTLGIVDVRAGDGRAIEELLVQPKRTALLVYLAVAAPRGYHRRDLLLPLFWPELDAERARAALRRALHFLRATAGGDVLSTRGDEIAVDPDIVRSDVPALDAAAAAGAPEQVVALHGGDFLAGLFVRGAPAFDQWQSVERDRIRGRVAVAHWSLADRAASTGDARTAADEAGRATALLPFDEAGLRRRLLLLRTLGDHAAALQVYEEFAARVHAELDAEPAAETRRIAASLRARSEATPIVVTPAKAGAQRLDERRRAPAFAAVAERESQTPGVAGAATEQTESVAPPIESVSPPDSAPRPSSPTARRRIARRLAAVGIAVVIAAAGALVARQRLAAARPGSEVTRVAILPFQVLGDPRAAYLGEGMVDLLGASLDGAGPLRPVDRYTLRAERPDAETLDPATGQAIARRVGASRFVLGSLVEAGGQLRVQAALYDVDGARHATATVAGPETALLGMVDDLTRQLLAGEYPGREARLSRLAIRTTTSLPALKAYLHGTRRMRDGRFGEAADSFRVAVGADSSFALAYYSLSMALGWLSSGRDHQSTVFAGRAVALANALGPHDDALLRAHFEAWGGDGGPDEAERLYRQILAAYPDDVEAWHELGELLFHASASRGQPLTDARPAFDHVLGVPALRGSALLHLARIAAVQGDARRLDSLAALAVAEPARDARTREIATLATFAPGTVAGPAARDSAATALAEADADVVWTLAWSVAMYTANWADSERMLALLTHPARQPGDRALGWLAIAQIRAAAGRPAASRDALVRAAALAPAWAGVTGATLAAMPFLASTRADRAAARASVTRWDGTLPPLASAIRLYPLPGLEYRARLLATLDAADATEGGAVDTAPPAATWRQVPPSRGGPLFPLVGVDRLAQADRLRRAGRLDEAAHWYAAFPDTDIHDVVFYAPAALALARQADAAGRREEAARSYVRAAWLWRNAEPPLRTVAGVALRRAEEMARLTPTRAVGRIGLVVRDSDAVRFHLPP